MADAWTRCCARAGVPLLASTEATGPLIAACPRAARVVVLVDHPLATPDSVRVLRTEGWPILLLVPLGGSSEVRHALGAGVDGLVSTSDPLIVLDEALAHLSAGRAYASPVGARLLLDDHRVGAPEPGPAGATLTERERDVLRAMIDGLTTRAVADRLGIALKTVEAHRSRIFDRLGVRNQREAVLRALRSPGLLERP